MDFKKQGGLVPAIIQDRDSKAVLMLGYMNEEALEKTRSEGKVTFYSRSKQRLWTKGESSGNFLHVEEIREDCDKDTLLIRVRPEGPACHTGADTCFDEQNSSLKTDSGSDSQGQVHGDPASVAFLAELQSLIQQRHRDLPEGSYTTSLFQKGINKIAQKVGEEAVELVIESKDDDEELFLGEASDLVYHLLVLLTAKGHSLAEVASVLEQRHR